MKQRYAELFLSELGPGSSGRKCNIDDAARFLRFGVERCGANAKWMPPKGERRREIIGAADAFHDEAKLTQPVTRSKPLTYLQLSGKGRASE